MSGTQGLLRFVQVCHAMECLSRTEFLNNLFTKLPGLRLIPEKSLQFVFKTEIFLKALI